MSLSNTLKAKIQELPNKPGVYQYFDVNNKLLYIGKAKNLQKRVKSYFSFSPNFQSSKKLSHRISIMIHETIYLQYIVVSSEHDALILENSLIKQMKPKYNILLRDDKTFPYIYIDLSLPYPRFEITRKVIEGKNIKYFGPFSSGSRELLNALYEVFPLVQKKNCLNSKKACLYFQIEKCLAPCVEDVDKTQYLDIVKMAIKSIHNRTYIVRKLESKMMEYASRELFEEAGKLRDDIQKLKFLSISSNIDLAIESSFDLFFIKIYDKKAIIIQLFIREGKITSSNNKTLKSDKGFCIQELYSRVLIEYYSKENPYISDEILVGEDFEDKNLIEQIVRDKSNKKLKISIPKIGDKKKLMDVALLNANEIAINDKDINIVSEIKDILELEDTPYNIECYDTSHMGGVANVGSLVFFDSIKFDKTRYRHYNLVAKDEYGQMFELLSARVKDLQNNPLPDMWLVDGGVAQLNLANDIVQSVGANLDVVAISKEKISLRSNRSKGGANDTLYTKHKKIKLSKNDKRLQYLQRIRDEAHRFAITYHRKKKLKQDKQISLLEIKGIGVSKVTKLLNYFESFENIKKATLEDLEKVIDKKSAYSIFTHFLV